MEKEKIKLKKEYKLPVKVKECRMALPRLINLGGHYSCWITCCYGRLLYYFSIEKTEHHHHPVSLRLISKSNCQVVNSESPDAVASINFKHFPRVQADEQANFD